jgi:RND family efflux transporter MFP subunit
VTAPPSRVGNPVVAPGIAPRRTPAEAHRFTLPRGSERLEPSADLFPPIDTPAPAPQSSSPSPYEARKGGSSPIPKFDEDDLDEINDDPAERTIVQANAIVVADPAEPDANPSAGSGDLAESLKSSDIVAAMASSSDLDPPILEAMMADPSTEAPPEIDDDDDELMRSEEGTAPGEDEISDPGEEDSGSSSDQTANRPLKAGSRRRRPLPTSTTNAAPAARNKSEAKPSSRPQSSTMSRSSSSTTERGDPQSKVDALRSLALDRSADAPIGKPKSSKLPWVLLILVIGGFGYYQYRITGGVLPIEIPGLPGLNPPAEKTEAPARKIETVAPSASAGRSLIAAGYIAAKEPITVGVTVSGRVRKVLVQNGEHVKLGHVMVQLDDTQTQAQLRLAYAKEHDAERNLARVRQMAKADAATATDLENAQGKAEIARAERSVTASLLEEYRVRSPMEGTVLEVMVHPGEIITVAPNTTTGLVRFADLRKLVIEADVNEADVSMVRIGQAAEVTSDAQQGRKYSGKVYEIAQQADRARGTVQVKVELERLTDNSLKPGMAVRASFMQEPDRKPRILIARGALDQGAVWVVDKSDIVARRPIETEPAGPSMLEVKRGLAEGERIVVEGWNGLHDGQKLLP